MTTKWFPADQLSVRAARRFVVSALEDWDLLGIAHLALLLTSELATNALLHARTEFGITARYRQGRCLRVEVWDGNTRPPGPVMTPVDATTGRGMLVVHALAKAWGVENVADGKVVWFELDAV